MKILLAGMKASEWTMDVDCWYCRARLRICARDLKDAGLGTIYVNCECCKSVIAIGGIPPIVRKTVT